MIIIIMIIVVVVVMIIVHLPTVKVQHQLAVARQQARAAKPTYNNSK